MVYDITCRKSFESVRVWMDQIRQKGDVNVDKVLLGNKCDMGETADGVHRKVSVEEGKQLADEFGIQFFETSAKEDINVEDAFMAITESVVARCGDQLVQGSRPGVQVEVEEEKTKKKGCC